MGRIGGEVMDFRLIEGDPNGRVLPRHFHFLHVVCIMMSEYKVQSSSEDKLEGSIVAKKTEVVGKQASEGFPQGRLTRQEPLGCGDSAGTVLNQHEEEKVAWEASGTGNMSVCSSARHSDLNSFLRFKLSFLRRKSRALTHNYC